MSSPVARLDLSASKKQNYFAWYDMIRRCTDQNHVGFHRYGGRGITICERWLHSFETFLSDMGERPSPRHSLDRINNHGPYEPENCRWATRKEQNANRRVPQSSIGATYVAKHRNWKAEIKLNHERFHLGVFIEKEHAMAAYRIASSTR